MEITMTRQKRGNRRTETGVVLSDKMQKTRIVGVERRVKHPFYGKYITRTTRLMVDDQEEKSRVGDVVRVAETRPLSRHKCWRLVDIIKQAEVQEEA